MICDANFHLSGHWSHTYPGNRRTFCVVDDIQSLHAFRRAWFWWIEYRGVVDLFLRHAVFWIAFWHFSRYWNIVGNLKQVGNINWNYKIISIHTFFLDHWGRLGVPFGALALSPWAVCWGPCLGEPLGLWAIGGIPKKGDRRTQVANETGAKQNTHSLWANCWFQNDTPGLRVPTWGQHFFDLTCTLKFVHFLSTYFNRTSDGFYVGFFEQMFICKLYRDHACATVPHREFVFFNDSPSYTNRQRRKNIIKTITQTFQSFVYLSMRCGAHFQNHFRSWNMYHTWRRIRPTFGRPSEPSSG